LSGIYYPFKTRLDEGHVSGEDSPLIKGDDHEAYTKSPHITEDQHLHQPAPGCSTKMSREQHRHQWKVSPENQEKQKPSTEPERQHFS